MAVCLVCDVFQTVLHKCLFVQWRVFIEVYILVFGLAYYLCTELQLISVLERQFEVCGYFQVLFHNVFLLLGQFFQLEVIAQSHCVSVEWLCERTALIAKINVEFLLFQLEVNVSLVGAFLGGTGISGVPVHLQRSEKMLAAQSEVHRALTFKPCVAVVGRTGLCLHANGCLSLFVEIL